MERISYEEIIDQIAEAALWLAAVGATGAQNRIHVHVSNIRKLVRARENGSLRKLVEQSGQTQLVWSLVEAVEFAEAYAALKDYDPNLLGQKLRDALKGPANPLAETPSSNLGRNTMFELNLAGHLHRKGLRIHLLVNPDIWCDTGAVRFYVQCKRPFGEESVPKNILAAAAQATRDIAGSGDSAARGLIAISLSRVLTHGDRLLVTKREAEVGEKLANEIQTVTQRHSRSWGRVSDKRIIGFLFHIIAPVFIEETTILTVAEQMVMFARPQACDADRHVLRDLSILLAEPA